MVSTHWFDRVARQVSDSAPRFTVPNRMLSRRNVTVFFVVALTTAIAASCGIAYVYHGLLSNSGLDGTTRAGTGFQGTPLFNTRDHTFRSEVVRAKAAAVHGPFSSEWRGYLLVPKTGRYRIVIIADDRASLEVDRQQVSGDRNQPAKGHIDLSRGLHPIRLRYEDNGGQQMMEVLWAPGTGTPASIPPLWLVPELRPFTEIRQRKVLAWLMPGVAVFWSLALLALAGVLTRLLVRRLASPGTHSFASVVLAVSAVITAAGLWWGLPDFYGWAPDELTPADVIDALTRNFAGGWAGTYPPFHYAVLVAFTSPFHALARIGLVDPGQLHVNTAMFVVQRLVSVLMALSTLGLVYAMGSAISPRAGAFAAATVSVTLPFAYYAKLANVDVPYVFWFALSMVFYLRLCRTGARADFVFLVLAGAAAIATKDQAYGFYVFPAMVLVVQAFRRARSPASSAGGPSLGLLAGMAALATLSLVLFENVLFNFQGFLEHVRIITGPGSQYFRMYDRTAGGQVRMLRDAFWQMGLAMSWPLFVIAIVAVVAAWRARVTTVRLLLLPLLSYYVTVIAVVGYHYDRFFIGPIVLVAVATGWWLDRWLIVGSRAHGLRVAAVCCAFAYALSRVVALDGMMMFDARYAAEQWLLQHASPTARIGAAGNYLPRGGTLFWTPLPQDPGALTRLGPDFVVVNTAFTRRWSPSSGPGRFYDALSRKDSPYRIVFRYRTELPWSPLRLEKRFTAVFDDPFSNLSKVNPLIEIYGR
jgi:hypothetical protein